MSAPKSVVKIDKNGVKLESDLDATKYYMHELNRSAMRDVGKFIRIKWREAYDQMFRKRSGNGRKATKVRVVASPTTEQPRCEIGLKTGRVDGFYAYFQEFGTSTIPRLGLLRRAVEDNIPDIIKIESAYLSGLEEEAAEIQKMINEDEYVDEEED